MLNDDKGDAFLINGRKLWITNGGEAGIFIVFANIAPEKGYRGITAFIVERDTAGFTVGKKENKLGLRGSDTAFLHFDDMKVPVENQLGEVGQGFKQMLITLDGGRISIGAMAVGLAQGAFDCALKYAASRRQFDRPIADNSISGTITMTDRADDLAPKRLISL